LKIAGRVVIRVFSNYSTARYQSCNTAIETVGLRSPKTLRKHFRAELNAGLAEATWAVARVAYEMANSGRYPQMTIFWDKCHRISDEDPEEELNEKNDNRLQARTGSGGFVFLPPRKAADAA
jgi:hypothetical protein